MNSFSRLFWMPTYALLAVVLLSILCAQPAQAQSGPAAVPNTRAQIHTLRVTLLSTMLVGDSEGMGEWGFSSLIEAMAIAFCWIPERTLIPCCKTRAICRSTARALKK